MSKYIWALPEGAFANMVGGNYDEQTQATLVDRTITKMVKAMSPQPPTVIVTPPPTEGSSPKLETHVMNESEKSSTAAACTAPEWYYATPAGLLDLTLMQKDLEQRSLDGRAHWEEKREKNMRDIRALFEEEALRTGSEIARTEGSSPHSCNKTRKVDGGMAAPKSREDDSWVKVKAPLKPPTKEENWELLDPDQCEEEWTLV